MQHTHTLTLGYRWVMVFMLTINKLQWTDILIVYENTIILKNHWTKHSLVYTHFDRFSMLIPNMLMKKINYDFFSKFWKISDKKACRLNATSTWRDFNVTISIQSFTLRTLINQCEIVWTAWQKSRAYIIWFLNAKLYYMRMSILQFNWSSDSQLVMGNWHSLLIL